MSRSDVNHKEILAFLKWVNSFEANDGFNCSWLPKRHFHDILEEALLVTEYGTI